MEKNEKNKSREFIGVRFKCCNKYSRIYKNKKGTAFVGWCPKCARKIEFKISKDGSKDRFFEVEY